MSRIRILVILLLAAHALYAQDCAPQAGFNINANVFTGKVIKHTEKFHLPVPDFSWGADVNFQWKTYGRAEWEQRRHYPTIGIAVAYTDYGIDSVYGKCISIYPNLEIPLITTSRIQWIIRIGDGVGYLTKKYSRQDHDTLNNAIGSHINDYASFLTQLRYHVDDHWDVQIGANFSHVSNASYHQPNLGVNLYGAHIGIRYFPVTSSPKRIVRELKPLKNRWLFQTRLGIAFNESNAPLGPTYPIYLATAYASKRWHSKNKAFAGIDYSYHEQINSFLHNTNNGFVPVGSEAANSYKTAVLVGNEFLLGRVGVILQVGYYLKQAFQTQGKLYQKIGGHLYLIQKEKGTLKELYLSAFLKTHLSTAELAEFGFGFSF